MNKYSLRPVPAQYSPYIFGRVATSYHQPRAKELRFFISGGIYEWTAQQFLSGEWDFLFDSDIFYVGEDFTSKNGSKFDRIPHYAQALLVGNLQLRSCRKIGYKSEANIRLTSSCSVLDGEVYPNSDPNELLQGYFFTISCDEVWVRVNYGSNKFMPLYNCSARAQVHRWCLKTFGVYYDTLPCIKASGSFYR